MKVNRSINLRSQFRILKEQDAVVSFHLFENVRMTWFIIGSRITNFISVNSAPWLTNSSFFLSFFLSVNSFIYLSIYLSIFFPIFFLTFPFFFYFLNKFNFPLNSLLLNFLSCFLFQYLKKIMIISFNEQYILYSPL